MVIESLLHAVFTKAMLRGNNCNTGNKTQIIIFCIKTTNRKINKTTVKNTAKTTIIN